MRLLLDTHVWLWQLLAPDRLSRSAARALADSNAELHLSPISVWETLVLARRGRLELRPDPVSWVRAALRVSPTVAADVTHEIAVQSEELSGLGTSDPADRFIVATCIAQDLSLVTADKTLRAYRGVRTIW